jgi:hypothetical protein
MRARLRHPLRFALLATLVPSICLAQAAATKFSPGSKLVSVGVLTGGENYEGFGAGGTLEIGAISFSKSVTLGIGGSLGYMRTSEGTGTVAVTVGQIPIYAIGNLHFSPPSQPKLDLFAGASVGVTYYRASGDVDDFEERVVAHPSESVLLRLGRVSAARRASTSSTETGFGIQGGGHFGLTNSMSVTAQIGLIDIPLFYGGVSFKF